MLGPTLGQCSGNVVWTLCEHQCPTLGTGIVTTFTQHCLNIVSTFVTNIESHVATTFTQCCLNIVSTLANVSHYCDNVVAMLGFWSKYNVGTTFTQQCLDIQTMLLGHVKVSTTECCHNVGTNVEPMLAPMLWQRCHNIGALAGMLPVLCMPDSLQVTCSVSGEGYLKNKQLRQWSNKV